MTERPDPGSATPASVAVTGKVRTSGSPESRRAAAFACLGLAVSLPILVWIYLPAGNGLDIRGHAIGRDFINVWAGTRLAFSGEVATLFDLPGSVDAIGRLFGVPLPFHSWSYPPSAFALFLPFAVPPYFVALAVWTAVSFAAFAWVTLSPLARERRPLALLLLVLAPASLINMVGGQNGFFSAALLLGSLLWLDRQPIAAGVLIGILTVKPQLGVVLPLALVALGAWRTIAAAAVTALLLVGLSIAVFGIEPWQRWLDVTLPFHLFTLQRFDGFYTTMMVSVLAGARTVGIPYGEAFGLQIAVALPVVAVAAWAVRRTGDPCRRAFVLASAAPLATPYAFSYDLTALAVPLVWVLAGRLPWRSRWRAVLLLAWVIPTGTMVATMLGLGLAPLVSIAVFAVAVAEAVNGPRRCSGAGGAGRRENAPGTGSRRWVRPHRDRPSRSGFPETPPCGA